MKTNTVVGAGENLLIGIKLAVNIIQSAPALNKNEGKAGHSDGFLGVSVAFQYITTGHKCVIVFKC